MNIWHGYKQERGCLVRFVGLANTMLKDKESASDNHVLACNLAICSPIEKKNPQKTFLIWLLATPPHLKHVATLPCNLSLIACFPVCFLRHFVLCTICLHYSRECSFFTRSTRLILRPWKSRARIKTGLRSVFFINCCLLNRLIDASVYKLKTIYITQRPAYLILIILLRTSKNKQ